MLKHSECGGLVEQARWEGPVLIGKGAVTVDGRGTIQAVGPVTATETIKAGSEPKSDKILFQCPNCGKWGKFSEMFAVIRVSVLSTKEAAIQLSFHVDNNGPIEIWVASDEAELARQVFSERALDWRMPFEG